MNAEQHAAMAEGILRAVANASRPGSFDNQDWAENIERKIANELTRAALHLKLAEYRQDQERQQVHFSK